VPATEGVIVSLYRSAVDVEVPAFIDEPWFAHPWFEKHLTPEHE
jgi:hypothetical protein